METSIFFAWSCIIENSLYSYKHLNIIQNCTWEKYHSVSSIAIWAALYTKLFGKCIRIKWSILGRISMVPYSQLRLLWMATFCCPLRLNQIKVFKTALHTKIFEWFSIIAKPTSVILSESSRTGSIQNKCSHLILLKKDELQPPAIVFLQNCIGFIRICHHIYRIFSELLNNTNNLSTNSTGTNRQEHQYLNSMAIDLMPNAMLSRQTTSKILLTENKIRRKLQVL